MKLFGAPLRHALLLMATGTVLGFGTLGSVNAQIGAPIPAGPANDEFGKLAQRARMGDPVAQFRLGQMHENGQGVVQSDTEAASWYMKSAEQGHDKAQARLGDLFKAGRGVPRNDLEAFRWYREAAQQGNPSAQNSLAAMLYEGRGVAQNRQEARAWWQKAADQGDPVAKVILAQLPSDDPASGKASPNVTLVQQPSAGSGLPERSSQTPVDPCAGFSNGTPVTVRLAGYPQSLRSMVLEASRGRATVQVMDMTAPPSIAGRRLDMTCLSLIRAE